MSWCIIISINIWYLILKNAFLSRRSLSDEQEHSVVVEDTKRQYVSTVFVNHALEVFDFLWHSASVNNLRCRSLNIVVIPVQTWPLSFSSTCLLNFSNSTPNNPHLSRIHKLVSDHDIRREFDKVRNKFRPPELTNYDKDTSDFETWRYRSSFIRVSSKVSSLILQIIDASVCFAFCVTSSCKFTFVSDTIPYIVFKYTLKCVYCLQSSCLKISLARSLCISLNISFIERVCNFTHWFLNEISYFYVFHVLY